MSGGWVKFVFISIGEKFRASLVPIIVVAAIGVVWFSAWAQGAEARAMRFYSTPTRPDSDSLPCSNSTIMLPASKS